MTTSDHNHENTDKLGFIVQQEAHRILSEAQLSADSDLEAQGWERRFITDGLRAREMVDLYTELGYEVHLEPLDQQEFNEDCEDCALVALLKFATLYTRKKQS
jgi:hypothetical protein